MHDAHQAKLESFGLSAGEAQVYLALLRSGGTLGASALAAATAVPRTGVYPVLNSLVQKGIVEAEAGYGSRFTAIRPAQALPSLIARERDEQKEKLSQRERLAGELVGQLEALADPADRIADAELIQVLRDPRVIAERFERLELEAERQIEAFVKAPVFLRDSNPAQEQALRRGVRIRGLYERAALDAPMVKPYLEKWLSDGEEGRVYNGELPHKLAIFDGQNILMPLITPGSQGRTLFIRHPQLATSLGMLFETLWERAEPISIRATRKRGATRLKRPVEKPGGKDGADDKPKSAGSGMNHQPLVKTTSTTRR
ncbi:MAG: helix-turn-helix domain-containing protein [Acidobacteria bacterium]|nr:helix-turn-helix domain-containing protein [Acidobacteriota bacterium]